MKVYLVGGAVRDTYLKKPVSDRDYVVVGGRHDEMLDLGYTQVGASFPVYLHPDTGEEYALARTERKTGPGYHGFETTFDPTVTIEDDLSRRDFTINAMAIDLDTADLIDPHGGFKDLQARTLRHVGPAFKEDPLRVVRLARFLGRLREDGFTVADETFLLAQEMVCRGDLNDLPWERFGAEVRKVLDTCTPAGAFTFFTVLNALKASQHVTFFAGMDLLEVARCAEVVVRTLAPEARARALVAAAFTDGERAEHVGGSSARDALLILQDLRRQSPTAEVLLETIRRSGGWSDSETYRTLTAALLVKEHLRHTDQPFTAATLLQATAVTGAVGELGAVLAEQGLKGAAIGQAIKDQRLKVLRALDLSLVQHAPSQLG